MLTLCLSFWETSRLFSQVAADFTFPPAETKGCNFSARRAAAPEPSYGVWSHVCLTALWAVSWLVVLDTFTCVYWPYLPQRNPYSGHLSFFLNITWLFKLSSCEHYVYALNTSHLPDISFAGTSPIFSVVFSFSWWYHLRHKCGDLCPPCHPTVTCSHSEDPFQPCLDTQIPRWGVSGLCLCRVEVPGSLAFLV